MIDFNEFEIWFVTGSQHLYGAEVLKQVETNSREIVRALNEDGNISVPIVFNAVLISPDEISKLIKSMTSSSKCVGIICWMHTFSPAKMWINGLKHLSKPMLHFHTQYNRDIPWGEIDMDFMNLNQTAHGGREFGHINTRLGIRRKVVVGHWQDSMVLRKIGDWSRVALGWNDLQDLKLARFGDNMREVAVTEGDKVAAQIQFGFSVNGFGLGDLIKVIDQQTEHEIRKLVEEYQDRYILAESLQSHGSRHSSLYDAAKIELGIRQFLMDGGFKAFTNTFENLHGMKQLPGIATQRLMDDGYGFGAEGDWKTAALVRAMKVMGQGRKGGNSFMEDYTYHFNPSRMQVLGSHMLEICPSISDSRIKCEIHPLGIGGKEDPVRLVFDCPAGPALNASLIDLGDRFRMLVNSVDALEPEQEMPKLPVARVMWVPRPNLKTAAEAWILAGGAHHTCYSQNVSVEMLEDFAEIAGIELCLIDENTEIREFKNKIRWEDLYYRINQLGKGF